jgi:transmembrane sensor
MPLSAHDTQRSEIRRQAIDWLVRLRSDDMSDEEVRAFANWLAEDAVHAEAFGEAEKLFDDMARAARAPSAGRTANPEPVRDSALPAAGRRSSKLYPVWLSAPLAAAAVWLLAVNLILPGRFHPLAALLGDYRTQTGEMREFTLSDGSRLLLNTASAVSVDFTESRRNVILHYGQARFTVAGDARRPFVVRANGISVRALGTVFDVYQADSGDVTVTVQEHAVAVSLDPAAVRPPPSEIEVEQGQELRYRPGTLLPVPEPALFDQATAWQRHLLLINDRPLSELVEELDRYRTGRIFLRDQRLEKLRITGVFTVDNPDKVLDSVCQALGLRQTRIGPWWVWLHR